jgi:hypothetical protein
MIRPKSHTKASLVLTGLILPFIFSATVKTPVAWPSLLL